MAWMVIVRDSGLCPQRHCFPQPFESPAMPRVNPLFSPLPAFFLFFPFRRVSACSSSFFLYYHSHCCKSQGYPSTTWHNKTEDYRSLPADPYKTSLNAFVHVIEDVYNFSPSPSARHFITGRRKIVEKVICEIPGYAALSYRLTSRRSRESLNGPARNPFSMLHITQLVLEQTI